MKKELEYLELCGMRFSPHAIERWSEWFDCHSLEEQLKESVPWGAQRRSDRLLLSPSGAVFVCDGNVVKTVLTKEQAIANMQMHGIGICHGIAGVVDRYGIRSTKRLQRIDAAAEKLSAIDKPSVKTINRLMNESGAVNDLYYIEHFYNSLNYYRNRRSEQECT